MVLNPIDKTHTINKRQDHRLFETMTNYFNLIDAFRSKHPTTIAYTYTRLSTASRLDRIYTSKSLSKDISTYTHTPFQSSDHTACPIISLTLTLQKYTKTKLWKMNTSLLQEPTYVENFSTYLTLWRENQTYAIDPLQWWEKTKLKIKTQAIRLGKLMKKNIADKQKHIQQQLQTLNPNDNTSEIHAIQQEQQHIQNIQIRGAMIRSRFKYWPENETPPESFIHYEKQKQQNKQTKQWDTTMYTQIIEYFTKIWTTLSPTTHTRAYLQNIKRLNDTQMCNDTSPYITPSEVQNTISTFQNNTSPGSDGIPIEFYKTLAPKISKILPEIYNNVYLRKQLTSPQKRAIVKLIPKIPLPKHPSQYRPISLLNCDYKILAKIIVQRLCALLTNYISPAQQCGMPNCKIDNIHQNILATIQYAQDTQSPITILQLDYSKAFDNVSHDFLFEILEYINIPTSLSTWIKILLKDVNLTIETNGALSTTIPIKKGVRQGCPLSMLLFILVTDILTQKINNSNKLHDILATIQYAQDTQSPITILQLDYSKAFDNVSHDFLFEILEYINIPTSLSTWIKILLKDVNLTIETNGALSTTIPIKKGVRQGCPLSMLLFILVTDILTQKINNSNKLHGCKLLKTNIKIQQYADDTTIIISDQDDISELHKILEEFSLHSGLSLNIHKSKILSNSPKITNILKTYFPNLQKVTKTKILGIKLAIETETNKENWQSTINKIRAIAFEYKFDTISIYGKISLINALINPHIIFLAKIFLPLKSQIKTLQYIIYKFLWSPSYIEPIKREKLIPDHKDGGIRMPDIEAKIKTAFILKLTDLLQEKNLHQFFTAYAKYNLHRKLKNLNTALYTQNLLNRPTPNKTWNQTLQITEHVNKSIQNWENVKFRDIYWIIANPTPNPLPKVNAHTQPTSWMNILLQKPLPNLFSPMEKETAFRIAHNAYLWGSFNTKLGQPKTKSTCKFCNRLPDYPAHVIYDCTVARQVICNLQKDIQDITQTKTVLSKAMVLYNTTKFEPTEHAQVTKVIAIYKQTMIEKRAKLCNLTNKNKIPLTTALITQITETIRGKIKVKMKKTTDQNLT